jgi:hypothetical protein
MGVWLGGVFLDGFEVSARIRFGGAQALAVHRLPGGARVIDAMGPDDDVIAWHGILSGSDAADRARTLDALRVAGRAVALSWDVFAASVVVCELKLEFCNSWWIPYQIACTVLVGTQVPGLAAPVVNALADVVADLGLAGAAPGIAAALTAVNAAGATAGGSQAFAAAQSALLGAGSAIAAAVAEADAGMGAAELPDLVSASGSLAALTAAAGYAGRAAANFDNAGF